MHVAPMSMHAHVCVGKIVYHGPREEVLPFFETLGFALPERADAAVFLQEVTSRNDQKVPASIHHFDVHPYVKNSGMHPHTQHSWSLFEVRLLSASTTLPSTISNKPRGHVCQCSNTIASSLSNPQC